MTGRPDPVEALACAVAEVFDPAARLAAAVSAAWRPARPQAGSGGRVQLHVEPGPGQSALLRINDVEVQLDAGHVRGLSAALNTASMTAPG